VLEVPRLWQQGVPGCPSPKDAPGWQRPTPPCKEIFARRQAAPGAALPPGFSQDLHECKRARPASAPATRIVNRTAASRRRPAHRRPSRPRPQIALEPALRSRRASADSKTRSPSKGAAHAAKGGIKAVKDYRAAANIGARAGAAWQITSRVPARPIPAPPCAPRSGPAYAQAAASHRSLQTRSGDRG